MANLSQQPLPLCPQWFSDVACSVLDVVGTGLNSNFSTALLGSLAGALAGAIAAQRIVESNKAREEVFRELRNTNAANMASFTTCNAALALKKQQVQPLCESFYRDRAGVKKFMAERATGQRQGNAPFEFVSDMRTFPAPTIPIASLKDLLFNKLSVAGRPLSLVCAIEDAALGLERAISARLSLIERIKSKDIPKEQLHMYYFGLRLPNGDINREYPDLVEAIRSYVDDLAFFSHLLCVDLSAHGQRLHERIPKRQRRQSPKPHETNFSNARSAGLLPPDDQYADWLKAFG